MTPEQIDAKLPRAATWPPRIFDTTDDEERAEAVLWLMSLVGEESESPQRPLEGRRSDEGVFRRVVTTGNPVIRTYEPIRLTKSNDWPPPHPPAPGITYHGPIPTGRDDER